MTRGRAKKSDTGEWSADRLAHPAVGLEAEFTLIVDGMPSRILLLYLAVELAVGTLGLFVLTRERRQSRAPSHGVR